MVHLCVPVLKRYDLLKQLMVSLQSSSVIPQCVYVIDNGRDSDRLARALMECPSPTHIYTPPDEPLGVAASWNWFIENVPEERIISNDDILLGPTSIAQMVAFKADLVWAGHGFSCFLIRDTCVQKLGLFDENISPGYAYYEDDDYLQRLDGRGTRAPSAYAVALDCGVQHRRSSTLASNNPFEMMEHHRRFKIAQHNYKTKWGLTFP